MSDIKLDNTGDLDVSTGDLVILDGVAATAQRLTRKLKFFLGEWFLDTRLGFPYYEQVLIKNPQSNVVTSLFREAINSDEAVLELNNLTLNYEPITRLLSVSFDAETSDGVLVFDSDFIVGA